MDIVLDKKSNFYKEIENSIQSVATEYSIDSIEKVSMDIDDTSCFLKFKTSVTTENKDKFDEIYNKKNEYWISSNDKSVGKMQIGYNTPYEWDVLVSNVTDSYIESIINAVAQYTINGTYDNFLKKLEKKFNSPELKILDLSMSQYYPDSYKQKDLFDTGLDGEEEYEIDGNKKDEQIIEETVLVPEEIIKQIGPFIVFEDSGNFVVGLPENENNEVLIKERFESMPEVDNYLSSKMNEMQNKVYAL